MSARVSIRQMRPDDADAVRELDVQAFTPYVRRFAGSGSLSPRRRENMLACLALNPDGCFVAEAEGLVGLVFSRRWGAVGWIGIFDVHPDWQGRGIGRQLLNRAAAQLEAAGCATIGLETMADSTHNVGLYTRAGFRPAHPTLIVEKAVEPPAQGPPFALLGEDGRAVAEVSQAALPGLDYAPEARNAREFGWGETLLVGERQPWAVAIVRTVPRREGPGEPLAEVAALAVRPEARKRVGEAVQVVEAFARERGLERVRLPVCAADWATLQAMLARGFRVYHLTLRLLLKGKYGCPPGVELSRWAM